MLFNPYSGKPRHPSDIASDPQGLLMPDPDEPMLASVPAERQPWTDEHLFWMFSSENGLEDCDMCKQADFRKVARYFEAAFYSTINCQFRSM